MPEIILYGLSTCMHCRKAREHLKDRDIPHRFIYVDLESGPPRDEAMKAVQKANPHITFPTILIGDAVVVGFDQDKLDQALSDAGY